MKLLKTDNIVKTFRRPGFFGGAQAPVKALDGVSIELEKGRCAALIGESGSGKTTLGRIICGLETADSGSVLLDGKINSCYGRGELAKKVQMIFQDPFASLNPKLSVGTMLSEAAAEPGAIPEVLDKVGLPRDSVRGYPHQFSGGQRQRIAIARALLKNPELIIADEPLSALDISIQDQLLRLFLKLKQGSGISFLFISHDIRTAAILADEMIVMNAGKVVEKGPPNDIISSPKDEYTSRLIAAIP